VTQGVGAWEGVVDLVFHYLHLLRASDTAERERLWWEVKTLSHLNFRFKNKEREDVQSENMAYSLQFYPPSEVCVCVCVCQRKRARDRERVWERENGWERESVCVGEKESIYIYIYMFVCVVVCLCMCVYMFVCVCVRVFVSMCVSCCVHASVHVCVSVYVCLREMKHDKVC